MPSILIIEDDDTSRKALAGLFAANGYEVTETAEYRKARPLIETALFDAILTDVQSDLASDPGILQAGKKAHPDTEVIIMTTPASVHKAVEAIQNGAADYVIKPFKNEELLFRVNKALGRASLRNQVRYLRQEVAHQFGFDNIVGHSRTIDELKRTIDRIADTDITVLIAGESGTGKELLAKVIHHHSRRRERPFAPINCSAIPENLLESELFGHVKGASAAAIADKRGLFVEANFGTVFLDEIGNMPPAIQARLLHTLQEQQVRPSGSNTARPIDVRIIAATNIDLTQKARAGQFREDLFYRLNVMPIHIPPLRERPEDIPILAEYFLRRIEKEYGRKGIAISVDCLESLLGHNWPGNVRELENTLKRAVALCDREHITSRDIIFISPREKRAPELAPPRGKSLVEGQKQLILKTLEENNWNYTLTADQLGIGRTTLWRKVKRFNLKQTAAQN